MKISNIVISGFRSIKETSISLPEFSIFIGRNNSGKSNVLSAIRFAFEGTKSTISDEDFFGKKNNRVNEINVQITINNVTKYLELCDRQSRPKIEACITDDTITVRRKATRSPLNVEKIEIFDPVSGSFGTPTGIDAALKGFLPELIYIEAFKDPSTEAVGKSSAILGKMLKQILTNVSDELSEDLRKSLVRTYNKLNISEEEGIEKDKRISDIKNIEKQINKHILKVFPNHSVRLQFETPKVEDIFSQSSLEMYDNGIWSSCERKGQGNQRILYFALLQALADQLRNPETEKIFKPFILLIEEPEAFLYPKIQRQIGFTLEEISLEHQVIIASHSSSIVTPSRIKNVIIVQKSSNQFESSFSVFTPVILSLQNKERHLDRILASTTNSDFIFSDFVLIVEGISDRVILEAILTRKNEYSFPETELVIVDCGSKDNLKKWSEITTSFNIKSKCLADLDILWNGAHQFLNNDPDLSNFCSDFWRLVRENKLFEKNDLHKIKEGKKKEAIRLINTNLLDKKVLLISKLKACGVWVLEKGEIENYVKLSPDNKSNYTIKAQEIREKIQPIPKELSSVLKWTVE